MPKQRIPREGNDLIRGARLREARYQLPRKADGTVVSQDDFAKAGGVTRVSISNWETGKVPDERLFRQSLERIAKRFPIDLSKILGKGDEETGEVRLKFYGCVPCGSFTDVQQSAEEITVYGPYNKDQHFVVRADGYSMFPEIKDDDFLICMYDSLPRPDAVVLAVRGDEATVKRLKLDPLGRFYLVADNPAFPPEEFEGWRVIGRVLKAERYFA